MQDATNGMRAWISCFICILLTLIVSPVMALDGSVGMHDPSTVIVCDGRYYVFGTGGGISVLSSNDGFTWRRSGRIFDRVPEDVRALAPKNNGRLVWAPDVIENNGQYYLYYAVSAWDDFVSAVGLATSPTLDSTSPNYKWTDQGVVVNSVEGQNLNAIDPGVMKASDGTMWLCYGSYHGNIELVQLDSKTGLRISPKSPVSVIASKSEASDVIEHAGKFYLFVNHGSCCQGAKSTYHILVGRSDSVTGPYLDQNGRDLVNGAGTLFLESDARRIGPGHFGRIIEDGIERFSCHYEADTTRAGRSVLDIRPLLWTADGWPRAGDYLESGTYKIQSKKSGIGLPDIADSSGPSTQPTVAQSGGKNFGRKSQIWNISTAAGGHYKVTNLASGRALTVVKDKSAADAAPRVVFESLKESDDQLWKIDQFPDGSYRLESKTTRQAMAAMGDSIGLSPLTSDEAEKWIVTAP